MFSQNQSQFEYYQPIPQKICPECGEKMNEHEQSYLLECDHCLSKKDEF